MSGLDDRQKQYWETTGAAKTFTHPIDTTWLAAGGVARDSRVLDYGCGYGRTLATLHQDGWTNLEGVDPARALIARGRKLWPSLHLEILTNPPALPHADGSIDVVLLFAVLTCIPTDSDQHALIAELHRVLRPGGLLYVSDYPLQDDARNRSRYNLYATTNPLPYGTFDSGDGAVLRHHEPHRLRQLLNDFNDVQVRDLQTSTMNGNPAHITQLLARA